jgi:hypothetical protein
MHDTHASRLGRISGEVLRGSITPEGAFWRSAYIHSDVDRRQWICSSHPGPEEEDWAVPQGSSLRETKYVLGAYVTKYIAKERNKRIA